MQKGFTAVSVCLWCLRMLICSADATFPRLCGPELAEWAWDVPLSWLLALLLAYTVEPSGQYLSCRNLQKKMEQSKKQDSSSLLSLAYKKELFSKLLRIMCLRIPLGLDNETIDRNLLWAELLYDTGSRWIQWVLNSIFK